MSFHTYDRPIHSSSARYVKHFIMFSTFEKKMNFYSRLDDRHIRGSTASDLKLPPESDTDSIADYADGENAGNEKTPFFRIFVQKIFFLHFFCNSFVLL